MNKKRLMSMNRWQIVPTDNVSPYAIQNQYYRFQPVGQEEAVDDTDMDLTQAQAVIDYIKGL